MDPLELRITLTSPPQHAPANGIASLALGCDALELSCAGILLIDPLTPHERNDLRWYLEEYWMWPYEGFAQRGKEVVQLLVAVEQRLYQIVFGSSQAASLLHAWRSQASKEYLISVISELPAALSLPWELLHDGQNFLALRADHPVSIVRRLPLNEQTGHEAAFAPPLRILLITSQPEGTGFVDPRSIARELFDELDSQIEAGAIELEFLRPPTLAALKTRLRKRKRPIHVLHFDGHGTFGTRAVKQGMLAFEGEDGWLDAVKAEILARVLRELLKLERWLLQGKVVVISGFGGIGKTSLACEAADWFTRTKMYDVACFVSFEHGGDATMLLSALGHFLGIYDGYYNPNDSKSALARLKLALKKQCPLVIADNLESILPEGEAPLKPEIRAQLWNVLLQLTEIGAGVLLTSRDAAWSEEELTSSSNVARLSLQGLCPNDAYALASRLLNTLGIDPIRAPYAELRDLLSQLDHHPLAIQLVLPTLRDMPISTIRTEFAALLPKFVDEIETGRNRSLLASLEYSLQRLSEEQRAFFPRLVPFQGGASEDDLLAITEFPQTEWLILRKALEQAALLRVERVHKDIAVPFLRFHPVLMPFLQGRYGAGDEQLLMRYALRYHALVSTLVSSDHRRPYAVRALARRELPNFRRALDLLIETGNVEAVSHMAGRIARFLKIFGLERGRDELLGRVSKVVAAQSQVGEVLTEAEWLHEYDLAENDYDSGNLQAAIDRFTALLRRIEEQPEGMDLGKGSYVHCVALYWLARCLGADGQPVAAERRLRDALTIIDARLKQYPDEQYYIRQHGVILAELGDILRAQGRYGEAQKAYEERLKINEQLGNLRSQAVALTQLGTLALMQRNYAEAQLCYKKALDLFHHLGEPEMEAIVWHQQGALAEVQEDWVIAERYYRESLAIEEQLGNEAGAALTCTQLAMITERSGRPAEAEGWCKRALGLDERVHPGSPSHARDLNTLARLLVNEVQAGRAFIERLTEARDYAERALAIREKFDASSEAWVTLNILADIADKEGRVEVARNYRCREREAFAAFVGNRYFIDHQFGSLIADVVATINGDMQTRGRVEAVLLQLEADGWHITEAIQRIWAGERDWHHLTEDMDPQNALLILRVLENLASSIRPQTVEKQDRT